MIQIKSEKARELLEAYSEYIDKHINPVDLSKFEFEFKIELIVSTAEIEAEERHAAELQALKKEIERCKSIFESIRDASLKTTTGNVSHQKAHITGMASRMVEFLTKNLIKDEKDNV